MKKIAVINDISGFGKCSLTAAVPVISAHGIQCCPLVTGVFSNQTGYESFKSADMTEHLRGFIDEWKKLNVSFDGILTGFIPNSRQGEIIAGFIDDFKGENTVVAVDPILGDDGKIYPCYDKKSIEAIKQLVKKADIITPNLTELKILCNKEPSGDCTNDEIRKMAGSLNVKTVIVTGLDKGDKIENAVLNENEFRIINSKKLGQHFSGTGDIFSSYVLSEYINKTDIFTAVEKASAFIEKAIEITLSNETEKHYHADGIEFEKLLSIK